MSTAKLLIIDPQNDFCDIPNAALPVPGANPDMQRVAHFLRSAGASLSEVIVTLDSHPQVAIERTSFWQTDEGQAVGAFTEITRRNVKEGRYKPRDTKLLPEVLAYLQALESGGRYRLMVWPIHCVTGTWGHNVHAAFAAELGLWEQAQGRNSLKILKGQNPLTEQYSAVRAEVPRHDDPATGTNRLLIERATPSDDPRGYLFVGGEAASHCVAATVEHLLEAFSPMLRSRVVLLRDGMSPVTGFEDAQAAFFARAEAQGVRVLSIRQALALLA